MSIRGVITSPIDTASRLITLLTTEYSSSSRVPSRRPISASTSISARLTVGCSPEGEIALEIQARGISTASFLRSEPGVCAPSWERASSSRSHRSSSDDLGGQEDQQGQNAREYPDPGVTEDVSRLGTTHRRSDRMSDRIQREDGCDRLLDVMTSLLQPFTSPLAAVLEEATWECDMERKTASRIEQRNEIDSATTTIATSVTIGRKGNEGRAGTATRGSLDASRDVRPIIRYGTASPRRVKHS